jgi:tetratricopeptide (TPR) repeat protein
MAACLGGVGRYAEAETHLRQILDLDPNASLAYYGLTNLYVARRMFVEALPFAEKAYSLAPSLQVVTGLFAGLLIRTGAPSRGNELVQTLGAGRVYGASMGLAVFHICCDEIDLAADWIEKAIEDRYPSVVYWLQTAIAEPLRASPHWPKLAALMNLPEGA